MNGLERSPPDKWEHGPNQNPKTQFKITTKGSPNYEEKKIHLFRVFSFFLL